MPTDFRPFLNWIVSDFEPLVRVAPQAGSYARIRTETFTHLYGVADMACVLYTINALRPNAAEHSQWRKSLQALQNPDTGYFVAAPKDHGLLHNTAFALGAMDLLSVDPLFALAFADSYKTKSQLTAHLVGLDWRCNVYRDSHDGAGIAAAFTLVPGTVDPQWFDWYFEILEPLFDRNNGMLGVDKPGSGDFDQIGGTFHYAFVYAAHHRRMPYGEARIDAVLGLQHPEGAWHHDNIWWLTLDALYLMTRSTELSGYRRDDIAKSARRVIDFCYERVMDPAFRLDPRTTPHILTAVTAILAETQKFLGPAEVVTGYPLRPILDRRPFI
ncbi:MAG TPA: hypothetical protein VGK19_18430 [Capsulimonadaceae bacterium]|jgi:hypothetical protein